LLGIDVDKKICDVDVYSLKLLCRATQRRASANLSLA